MLLKRRSFLAVKLGLQVSICTIKLSFKLKINSPWCPRPSIALQVQNRGLKHHIFFQVERFEQQIETFLALRRCNAQILLGSVKFLWLVICRYEVWKVEYCLQQHLLVSSVTVRWPEHCWREEKCVLAHQEDLEMCCSSQNWCILFFQEELNNIKE